MIPLVLACLGAAHHLAFSLTVGQFAYFKAAYDEDTYFLIRNENIYYRFVSKRLTEALYSLTGPAADLALILPDIVLPALAALAALYLASRLARTAATRALIALLLLFGQDLFSMSNMAVWQPGLTALAAFKGLFGGLGPQLVPDASISFLNLYRTPEPQLSYGLLFVVWAVLIDLARSEAVERSGRAVALALCLTLLSLGYTFLFLPALASAGVVMLIALAERRWGAVALLASVILLSAGVFAGATASASARFDQVYRSHLPILTPAVIASALAAAAIAVAAWCTERNRGPLVLALALAGMPALLCNQQIVTGVMISARDWERNIAYPLLVAGIALAVSTLAPAQGLKARRLMGPLVAAALVAIAGVIGLAQVRSYEFWLGANLRSMAMVRALQTVPVAGLERARLVLDEPGYAPLLAVRLGRRNAVLDYTDTIRNRVKSMGEDGASPQSPHETNLFEYFWRTGRTPEDVHALLAAEAQARGGFFLAFLFSYKDYWYPSTDNRLVRQAEIERALPAVVDRYRHFLASDGEEKRRDPVIRLSALTAPPSRHGLEHVRLASGTAGGETIYAYLQQTASTH